MPELTLYACILCIAASNNSTATCMVLYFLHFCRTFFVLACTPPPDL